MKKTAIVVLLVACGGGDDGDTCKPPSGVYRDHWVEDSGDCGPIEDGVQNATGGLTGPTPTGCVDHDPSTTMESCSISFDRTCTISTGVTMRSVGVLTVGPDGESMHMVTEKTITRDGKRACSSVYTVTFTRP